jgi:hypothetical protein
MPSKPLFDDGVHFVRHAYKNDKHPLRFVVASHKAAVSKRKRHVDTLENAIEVAKLYTQSAAEKSEVDAKLAEEKRLEDVPQPTPTPPPATSRAPEPRPKKAEPKAPALPKFNSSYFTCKVANPVAQVWECTKLPGERKSAGRKRKDGKSINASRFNHQKGECAVLLWSEPVRDPDGAIKVYPNWLEADAHALSFYEDAYEEGGAIDWKHGQIVMQRLTDVEICFDPSESVHWPFYLMINKNGFRKPFYVAGRATRYVTAAKNADGSAYQPPNKDAKEAHEFNRKLERMFNEEFRNSGLTESIARFKTPWEAEKQAIELECTYCGNGDLYG